MMMVSITREQLIDNERNEGGDCLHRLSIKEGEVKLVSACIPCRCLAA
jgi:hypothetical protein